MIRNWASSQSFRPAVVVTPKTFQDVTDIVRNTNDYPSPLRPLGESSSLYNRTDPSVRKKLDYEVIMLNVSPT